MGRFGKVAEKSWDKNKKEKWESTGATSKWYKIGKELIKNQKEEEKKKKAQKRQLPEHIRHKLPDQPIQQSWYKDGKKTRQDAGWFVPKQLWNAGQTSTDPNPPKPIEDSKKNQSKNNNNTTSKDELSDIKHIPGLDKVGNIEPEENTKPNCQSKPPTEIILDDDKTPASEKPSKHWAEDDEDDNETIIKSEPIVEESANESHADQANIDPFILSLSTKYTGALHSNIGLSWFKALHKEFKKPYFEALDRFMRAERQNYTHVFPPPEEVWSWTHHFNIEDTKVVILGKIFGTERTDGSDPDSIGKNDMKRTQILEVTQYHNRRIQKTVYKQVGGADPKILNLGNHGFSYSVRRGAKIPPAVTSIYKELKRDENIKFTEPDHAFLEGWAKQGVLLLNDILTIRQIQSPKSARCVENGHKDRGWEKVTDAVLRLINEKCNDGVVFLVWGKSAQIKVYNHVNSAKHYILETSHPVRVGGYEDRQRDKDRTPIGEDTGKWGRNRHNAENHRFIGCNHFSKCNDLLVKGGRKPIDWSNL